MKIDQGVQLNKIVPDAIHAHAANQLNLIE